MSRPKAYEPADGYKFQIFTRNLKYGRAWEHCDYGTDRADKNYLIGEYRTAYGAGWEFKSILLPRKYWPKRTTVSVP
jgi:hypothetical protein